MSYKIDCDDEAKKEIDIPISDEELEEMREGKHFHWCFDEVDVHLFNAEEGE